MHSEDWDIVVPLFKSFRKIGKKNRSYCREAKPIKFGMISMKLVTLFFNNFRAKIMLKQTTGKKITKQNVHY